MSDHKFQFSGLILPMGAQQGEKPKADEKPERFVTSDAEAMHAATIRSACAALNDAVKAAAKDGLKVEYEGKYEGGIFGAWSPTDEGGLPPIVLTPTILRTL